MILLRVSHFSFVWGNLGYWPLNAFSHWHLNGYSPPSRTAFFSLDIYILAHGLQRKKVNILGTKKD